MFIHLNFINCTSQGAGLGNAVVHFVLLPEDDDEDE